MRIVYLVDLGTLNENGFAKAKSELNRSIESLDPRQSFNLYCYSGDSIHKFQSSDKLVKATDENRTEVFRWMRTLDLVNSVAKKPPFEAAFDQNADVVYIVTKGGISNQDVSKLMTRNSKKAVINVIGIGGLKSRTQWQRLATSNQGQLTERD